MVVAVNFLGTLIDRLVAGLVRHEDNWKAVLEFREIADLAALPALKKHLNHSFWLVRWCIADTLGNINDKSSIDLLLPLLADDDHHVRHNAKKSLIRLSAIPLLTEQLSNSDSTLANQAAKSLGQIGGPLAIAGLCRGLRISAVRETCVVALGVLQAQTSEKITYKTPSA